MPDDHKNLAYSIVATAPSPGVSGTSLIVSGGQGARFPVPPFNATICPVGFIPTPTNAEIVRVTNVTADTLTIARAQEGTLARAVVAGDQIFASITAKTLTDIESVFAYRGFMYKTAVQTIPDSIFTKVAFETMGSESGPPSMNVTTSEFTIPFDGWYQISARAGVTSGAGRMLTQLVLVATGIAWRGIDANPGYGGPVSVIERFSVGHVLILRVFVSPGTSMDASHESTFFSAAYLGP